MKSLKIKLAALDQQLIAAWKTHFSQEENVEIIAADITTLECDAIVSPANSFGFMDGGLDYQLSVRFGWDLEKRLQKLIRELPEGELLVGQALVMETMDQKVPWLISAPTMRVPTNFQIGTSINAYLAMKAILINSLKKTEISSVAIPGLCTGTGGMKHETAANQMFQAYQEILLGHRLAFNEFGDAQKHQWNLNQDTLIWTN